MKNDIKEVYLFKDRPESVKQAMQQAEMIASMERQRIARQFPWKRKGYRKHIK